MKELKRNSLVFKIAYGMTENWYVPTQVSRCELFWRVVGMSFVRLFLTIVGVTIVTILSVGALLFGGYRVRILKSDPDKDSAFVQIKHWPKVGGRRPWPSLVLLVGFALYYAPHWITWLLSTISSFVMMLIRYSTTFGVVFGSVAILVVTMVTTVYFANRLKKSDAWDLFKDYLHDKKKGLCPFIPIEQPLPDNKKD